MSFSLPNPTVPTNGQPLDATPLLANLVAIAQAIQSFDGSQVQAGSIVAAAMNASINPNTLLNETTFPFVQTGCVWSSVSGLNGGMTSGVIYYNGIRVPVNSISSHAFTASKDTYIDVDVNGNVAYSEVNNNATSPSLTANSIRIAIVASSGAALTFINQGQTDISLSGFAPVVSSVAISVTDTIGNLIYPTDPRRSLLGQRSIVTSLTGLSVSTSDLDLTGLVMPFILPAGRKVELVLYVPDYSQSGGIGTVDTIFKIKESSTLLGSQSSTASTANFPVPATVITPALALSTGLHTVKASIASNSTGPAWAVDASSTSPTYLNAILR